MVRQRCPPKCRVSPRSASTTPPFRAACRVSLLAAPDGPCGLRLPSALGRPRIQGEGRGGSGAGAYWTSRCKGGGGPPGAGGDTEGAPSYCVNGPSHPRLPSPTPAYMLAEAGILQPPLPRLNMRASRPPLLPLLPPRAAGAGSVYVHGASLPIPPLAPLPSPPLPLRPPPSLLEVQREMGQLARHLNLRLLERVPGLRCPFGPSMGGCDLASNGSMAL